MKEYSFILLSERFFCLLICAWVTITQHYELACYPTHHQNIEMAYMFSGKRLFFISDPQKVKYVITV